MSSVIKGFVSRADAGLASPKSVSKIIAPNLGGVAVHHGGGAQSAAKPDADHDRCITTWKSWQTYHMKGHGWSDIAYTGGFCNHGYAFAGRGIGVRTAANGTNSGNAKYYAVVWIGGSGQKPTQDALNALEWWIDALRKSGAANAVRPHKAFKSTSCPGDALTDFANNFGRAPVAKPKPKVEVPTPADGTTTQVKELQRLVRANPDGKWGPSTDEKLLRMRTAARAKRGWPTNVEASFDVKEVQRAIGTQDDGIWGPLSDASLRLWVKNFQELVNLKPDGAWGPKTDGKFISVRRRYLNNY